MEEILGWLKTVGLPYKLRHLGMTRIGRTFTRAAAVYNPVRIGPLTLVS
jgi:hypothetical protein